MNSIEHRGFIITVDSIPLWVAFMSFIKEQEQRVFDDGLCLPDWVYRGQSNSDWGLTSSFERKFGCDRDESDLIRLERHSINVFKELSQENQMGLHDAELLAFMQHYGVPTRLIDFTHAPLIALFFALFDDKKKDDSKSFAVWATQSNAVNSWYDKEIRFEAAWKAPQGAKSIHAKESDSTKSNNAMRVQVEREVFERLIVNEEESVRIRNRIAVAMYCPVSPNPRMRAQRGLFLASTRLSQSFELAYYDWKYFARKQFEVVEEPLSKIFQDKRVVVDCIANADAFKFVFPASMREEAKSFLDIANVRQSVIFPDFEGVSKEVAQEMERFRK